MAEDVRMIQYRSEFIESFEQRKTYLRETVITEAVLKGNQATFLVAGSDGGYAITRGANGRIPARSNNNVQSTATLTEQHAKYEQTSFNIWANQGDQRRIMQMNCMADLNRTIDKQILDILSTGTNNTGAATTASLNLVMKARTILGNNTATDGELTLLMTDAFWGYLAQVKEFTSADWTINKPFAGGVTTGFRWGGINFMIHPNLPGKGTAVEKCFLYNKSAIGHAMNVGGENIYAGYNEEDDFSYSRCTAYMGGVLLQNAGVVVINHNATGLVS